MSARTGIAAAKGLASDALSGLRVGYCVGPAALIAEVRKAQLPFSVGSLAQAAAVAALGERAEAGAPRRAHAAGAGAGDVRPARVGLRRALLPHQLPLAAPAGGELRLRRVLPRPRCRGPRLRRCGLDVQNS
ncbi:aminotransferase class I/II-fold pyridoxal phosphate-dependent enzyme [Streptacidiphilus melanogenes]|uniref:aminotransferase class I/II-fold pyridoxal phosphate-dependent enzyme n=1 Tax=Streptacidiphilus melanogenes TaxID=411235 RepID=UPI00126A3B05|nr:aminotransferase class I/II-fold pyridoxal phosphate-dependent enzyme [Streptacidiphilus melanogenes]